MTPKALKCPCGFETNALKALVKHQTLAHSVGEREIQYYRYIPDDVTGHDEDANKRADL